MARRQEPSLFVSGLALLLVLAVAGNVVGARDGFTGATQWVGEQLGQVVRDAVIPTPSPSPSARP